MSWLDENKDRGRHPQKDEETDLLDSLMLLYREHDYKKAAEKAWDANQKIMEREHPFTFRGMPIMTTPVPKLSPFYESLISSVPVLNPAKAFIPDIDSIWAAEDPEIRIKVRKRKLKFNFNN